MTGTSSPGPGPGRYGATPADGINRRGLITRTAPCRAKRWRRAGLARPSPVKCSPPRRSTGNRVRAAASWRSSRGRSIPAGRPQPDLPYLKSYTLEVRPRNGKTSSPWRKTWRPARQPMTCTRYSFAAPSALPICPPITLWLAATRTCWLAARRRHEPAGAVVRLPGPGRRLLRGGRVANILEFPGRFAGCQVIRLTTNYRSHRSISDEEGRWMDTAARWEEAGQAFRYAKSTTPHAPEAHPEYSAVTPVQAPDSADEGWQLAFHTQVPDVERRHWPVWLGRPAVAQRQGRRERPLSGRY